MASETMRISMEDPEKPFTRIWEEKTKEWIEEIPGLDLPKDLRDGLKARIENDFLNNYIKNTARDRDQLLSFVASLYQTAGDISAFPQKERIENFFAMIQNEVTGILDATDN